MHLDIEGFHHLIRDFNACRIGRGDKMSLNGQTGLGFGVVEIVEHQIKGPQGTTSPRFADFAEQPMFDGVPFRCARWVMTDRDRQAMPIGQFVLKLLLKDSAV